MVTIEFEDHGQDFLEWDIDEQTGKVVDCRPFQASVWCKCTMLNEKLKVGDKVEITSTIIDEPLTVNYPVQAIYLK